MQLGVSRAKGPKWVFPAETRRRQRRGAPTWVTGEVRRLEEFNYAVLERQSFEALVVEIDKKIEQFRRK